jgi:hypothetical protein
LRPPHRSADQQSGGGQQGEDLQELRGQLREHVRELAARHQRLANAPHVTEMFIPQLISSGVS